MKSIARKCLAGLMLLAALAVTVRLAAQQQPEGSTSVDTGTANPVPLINQPLVPDAARPGGVGFQLTVNGTGFVSGSVVNWNGSARATTFVSNSKLTASILASDIATARTASVTVVSPGPGGGRSNVGYVVIHVPNTIFSVTSSFLAGNEAPERPVLADVNGDGKLDLIGEASNAITVRLGNGDGTFQPEIQYPACGTSPIVADFNGDGKLDIAVHCPNFVSVYLGNGDGTFQAPIDSPLTRALSGFQIAAADLNGDGKLDLVIGYQDPNTSSVSVLLGNGDGTFQAQVDYPAGFEPGAIAIADLNRDGKLDIVTANFGQFSGNTVSVLLGNGDGTFQPPVQYPTSQGPLSVIAADFNGDGILDLAVDSSCGSGSRCGYPGEISILLGNGDGTFQPHVDYPADAFPYTVTAGDLTANGVLDLAVTDLDYSELSILLGNGNGTFGSATTFHTSNRAVGVALGDLNGDGALDVVVGTDSGFTIFLQNGTVALSPPSVNFGIQLLGFHSLPRSVMLINTGTGTLTISGIAITGSDPADFSETNNCGASLPPGGHCTFGITFTPAQLGPRTAALTITDNAPGSPQSVPLNGFGVTSGPNATLSPTSLTFAIQLVGTTSPAQSVTLSNYGTMLLNITSIIASGDFSQSNTCGLSLAPLASCTISVTFTPTQGGTRTGTVSITDNAPGSPQMVNLTGVGTVVELNPTSLSFGNVPVGQQSSPKQTTLTNGGSTRLNISSITITGADPGDFSQMNNCGTGIGGHGSCTITVTFRPTVRGTRSADVSISDDGGGSPQQVSLSGVGCIYNQRHKCIGADEGLGQVTARSALAANQITSVPGPTGISRVGTRVMRLVDNTRDDPYVDNRAKRELLVRFWYPASLTAECKPADYASPKVWSYFSELVGVPAPEVKTNSCLEAPVVDGAHPVVVFTPGYTGTFTDYTFILEDLASRGYIVASVDHTYEATAAEFPDGRFVKGVLGSHLVHTWQIDDETLSLALSVRSADLKFVLDELERLSATAEGPFSGRLDTSRIGLMGHSLGGLATISGMQGEPRFGAAVLLDAQLGDESFAGTDKAALILAAGRERWSESECMLWSNLRGPRFAVNLRGAEHLTPTDAVWLAKGAIKTGSMGPEKTIEALRNYVAAFLETNLRGEPFDPLLRGPSSDYPDAAVTTQKQSLCGEVIEH